MRRSLLALVTAALVLLGPTAPAGAHAELFEADPPVDGEVAEGVTDVTLTLLAWDAGRPVEVEVTDPSGADVTTGEPVVEERTRQVVVPTEPLQPGQHIVHWHAWADDGDGESEGTFRFTVTEAPGGGLGIWLIWIVALGIPAAIFLRPGARARPAD